MKKFALSLLAIGCVLLFADPLFAQSAAASENGARLFSTPHAAAGFGAALAIFGAALGFGKIGAAALESMARQPEVAPRIFTAMLIIGALLEGATFFGLAICIIMALK